MIARALGAVGDTLGGLWVLLAFGVRTGFRFRLGYWRWRMGTAFPNGKAPVSRSELAVLTLDYARWAWRIRRLR